MQIPHGAATVSGEPAFIADHDRPPLCTRHGKARTPATIRKSGYLVTGPVLPAALNRLSAVSARHTPMEVRMICRSGGRPGRSSHALFCSSACSDPVAPRLGDRPRPFAAASSIRKDARWPRREVLIMKGTRGRHDDKHRGRRPLRPDHPRAGRLRRHRRGRGLARRPRARHGPAADRTRRRRPRARRSRP